GLIAGLVFAFIPYRFHLLSQLHYVFSGWLPLTLEALVLFARRRSPGRAAWLAIAFTMNGLSCLSWFVLSLVPLALSFVFLSIRYRLWRGWPFLVRRAPGGPPSPPLPPPLFFSLPPLSPTHRVYLGTAGPSPKS